MGEIRNIYKIFVGKWKTCTDVRIILGWNRVGRCGFDSYGSEQRPVVGACEHSSEPSGSIKGTEFLN
jgi:hypothetical protein